MADLDNVPDYILSCIVLPAPRGRRVRSARDPTRPARAAGGVQRRFCRHSRTTCRGGQRLAPSAPTRHRRSLPRVVGSLPARAAAAASSSCCVTGR
jgi:hypothetical protein